jgi:hypothetical protein
MQEINNLNEEKIRSIGFNLIWKVIILLLVVIIGYVGWKYYGQRNNNQSLLSQPQNTQPATIDKAAQAEIEKATQELLAKIGKLIVLPNEKPTFATILDAKKLIAEQSFYAGSENGDQLLIFQKAQKAIIYSPTRNILVNVGPVYFNNATTTSATQN